MPTRSFIQRLQRHYAYFKGYNGANLPPGCVSIELIDDDNLTSWFVSLAYKDDSGGDFFVSLRVNFTEDGNDAHPVWERTLAIRENADRRLAKHFKETSRQNKVSNSLSPSEGHVRVLSPALAPLSPSGDNTAADQVPHANAVMKKEKDGTSKPSALIPTTLEVSPPVTEGVTAGKKRGFSEKVVRVRMPTVLVICPRLNAPFIHHGAICSLELMSQYWEHTVENVTLLITTLYHTLNPFDGTSRVSVGVAGSAAGHSLSVSRYTDEEHRDGIRFIAHSHPHLFRRVPHQHGPGLASWEKYGESGEQIGEVGPRHRARDGGCVRLDTKRPQWRYLNTIDEVKHAIYDGLMYKPLRAELEQPGARVKGDHAPEEEIKAVLNIVALLQSVVDLSNARRYSQHAVGAAWHEVEKAEQKERVRVVVAQPRRIVNASHKLSVMLPAAGVCRAAASGLSAPQHVAGDAGEHHATPLQIVLDVLLPPCCSQRVSASTVSSYRPPPTSSTPHHTDTGASMGRVHISGRAADFEEEGKSDHATGVLSQCLALCFPIALVLRQGKASFPCLQSRNGFESSPSHAPPPTGADTVGEFSDSNDCRSENIAAVVPCTIPEGLSLTLSNVWVYGHVTVHGHLRLRNCRFIGTIACEMSGRVHLEGCRVGIDVERDLINIIECISLPHDKEDSTKSPETQPGVSVWGKASGAVSARLPSVEQSMEQQRHEGVLILDASRVEIVNATLVSRAQPLSSPSFFFQTAITEDAAAAARGFDAVKLDQGQGRNLGCLPSATQPIEKSDTVESISTSLLLGLISPAIAERLRSRHTDSCGCSSAGSDFNWDRPPPVLRALVFASNNAKLFVHESCLLPGPGPLVKFCRKIVFAEQNASVDINHCVIVAGCEGAVCIQGCQGLFHKVDIATWHYFTAAEGDGWTHEAAEAFTREPRCSEDHNRSGALKNASGNLAQLPFPTLTDTERGTGLVVEQGGYLIAQQCRVRGLYFGFSATAFSVAHFHSCHANHVVNGYTVDASTSTFENCSVRSNHVGVFALNRAKCKITEHGHGAMAESFEARCAAIEQVCQASRRSGCPRASQKTYKKGILCGNPRHAPCAHGEASPDAAPQRVRLDEESVYWSSGGLDQERAENLSRGGIQYLSKKIRCYQGKSYGIEVRGATVKAEGITIMNATRACVYAYPQYREQHERQKRFYTSLSGAAEEDASSITPSEVELRECILWGLPTQSSVSQSPNAATLSDHSYQEFDQNDAGFSLCCSSGLVSESGLNSSVSQANDVCGAGTVSGTSPAPVLFRARRHHMVHTKNGDGSRHKYCFASHTNNDGSGVKLIQSSARVYRCFAVDVGFAFVVLQQATAAFAECMAVRGCIGFTVKNESIATLHDCGAFVEGIALLAQEGSQVDIDWVPQHNEGPAEATTTTSPTTHNSPQPSTGQPLTSLTRHPMEAKFVCGFPVGVFIASLNGIECMASVVRCHGIAVLHVRGSAFNAHGGSTLHIKRCTVDLSPEGAAVYLTQRLARQKTEPRVSEDGSGGLCVNVADPLGKATPSGLMETPSDACHQCHPVGVKNTRDTALYTIGVKVWSSSVCYIDEAEIRGVACGVAAIGPGALVHAHHTRIRDAQNGLKIESAAQAEFVNCDIQSAQDSIHISGNARCLIQQGSYAGELFGVVCTDSSLLRIQRHVMVSGFSHAGIYLSDSAILEAEEASLLEVKAHRGDGPQGLWSAAQMDFSSPSLGEEAGRHPSTAPQHSLPVCILLEDNASAMVHRALLGGGAACGIRAQTGALGFFHHCIIRDVQWIGLHVMPVSNVYVGSGSIIDMLDEGVGREAEASPRHAFGGVLPGTTPAPPTLPACPYSLVVEHGAGCNFLPPAGTLGPLQRCWLSLPVQRVGHSSLSSVCSGVAWLLKRSNLIKLIAVSRGWFAGVLRTAKLMRHTWAAPPGKRFVWLLRWARPLLRWATQTSTGACWCKTVLSQKGKAKPRIHFGRGTKMAALHAWSAVADAPTDGGRDSGCPQNTSNVWGGPGAGGCTHTRTGSEDQCHASLFTRRSNGEGERPRATSWLSLAFRLWWLPLPQWCATAWRIGSMRFAGKLDSVVSLWPTQMEEGNMPWQQAQLSPSTTRISGRCAIRGMCSLYEVCLQLPVAPSSLSGVADESVGVTQQSFTAQTTEPIVPKDCDQGRRHHDLQQQGPAFWSLANELECDGYGCSHGAAVVVRSGGTLTLRRCSLACLPAPSSFPAPPGVEQLDYHVLCCSGTKTHLHLCDVRLKVDSLRRETLNRKEAPARQRPSPFSEELSRYRCNQVIIHAVNRATATLCCVASEGLHSPPGPCLGVHKNGRGSCATPLRCDTEPLTVLGDVTSTQRKSSGAEACNDTGGLLRREEDPAQGPLTLSPTPPRELLRIGVHACGRATVCTYLTWLHHLLARHEAKLTVARSVVAGPAPVVDIQTGAELRTQQSLLLVSCVSVR